MILARVVAAAGFASILFASSVSGQCVPSFATPPSFPAGNQPRTLVVANLNGDAYPDLVVGSWDYNGYEVAGMGLLTGGPNGLQLTDLLYDGHQVVDVVAGDFDADGDDDVAFHDSGEEDGTVRMLRNDSGALVESASFTVPLTASFVGGLAAGDFNGDGLGDVVFLSSDAAFVFLSRGDGSFEQKTFGKALDLRPLAVDLDRDGRDELITGRVAETVTTLQIFAGDPAKGLVPSREIAADSYRDRLAAGDFDGDGALDLIALSSAFGPVDMIYTAANATSVTVRLGGIDLFGRTSPEVADVDGDGVDDLVFEWEFPGHMTVAFGRRDRTLVRGADVWLPGRGDAAYEPHGVAVADFDLDGDIDVTATESRGVVLLTNDGDGSLRSPRFGRFGVLAVGDFNGDGRTDVLDENGVALAGPGGSIAPGDYPSYPYDWAGVADFNGDGLLDAVYYTDTAPAVYTVRLGNGDGTLRAQELSYQPGRRAEAHFIADLNGDAIPDLGQTNNSFERGLTIGIGNGDGTFRPPVLVTLAAIPDEVVPGDFDGDGSVDLAVTQFNAASAVAVLLNDGTGHFDRIIGGARVGGEILAAGDFNGDGLADIVSGDGSTLWVQLSEGDALAAPVVYEAGTTFVHQIAVRDFNHDGHLDLLATDSATTANMGTMGLLLGNGSGAFGPLMRLRSDYYGEELVGDFNGDGQLDLLDSGFVRLGSCAPVRRRAAHH